MNRTRQTTQGTVAYILKGYPRLSEIFITSEIYRLEQLGVKLRLAVIKHGDEVGTNGLGGSLYDWRELRRWGIAESRLPPGSVVLFRPPTVWE